MRGFRRARGSTQKPLHGQVDETVDKRFPADAVHLGQAGVVVEELQEPDDQRHDIQIEVFAQFAARRCWLLLHYSAADDVADLRA